jgi:hypothetical protein
MGYDRFPELVVQEKAGFLADVVARGVRVVFTHDPDVAASTVRVDDRGRFAVELS